MKVGDIMTKDVITVSNISTVKDAANLIFRLQISGLPVVDENEHVVGMITEKDLIRMALPSYIEQVGDLSYLPHFEPFDKKLAHADKIKISDIMRKDVICLTEDVDVVEAARIMITKGIRRIPVLRDKKLVGIICRSDIVKEIVKRSGILEVG